MDREQYILKYAGQGAAAAVGTIAPIFAGLGAEKGKGWKTTGGALLGNLGGGILGGAVGYALTRNPDMIMESARVGGHIGAGVGAYVAHGKNTPEDERLFKQMQRLNAEQEILDYRQKNKSKG